MQLSPFDFSHFITAKFYAYFSDNYREYDAYKII